MKTILCPLVIVSILLMPTGARALEMSKDVKVRPLLKTSRSWDGKPIAYPRGEAEVTGLIITIAPGGQTGWHLHGVPSFGMVLEGRLDVSLKTGQIKHFKPGDSIMEVVNTLHNGRNVGKTPVKLVVFYAGVKGSKLTVKESAGGKPAAPQSAPPQPAALPGAASAPVKPAEHLSMKQK